ncbi:hypothetical protein PR048_029072 [Dryococelus australis]|uniref:Uncharacterized protein n=1 Tax=Dryococelus australis TaxID=614101 RepID=A0ABQ9GFV3_9NEOP|nr:hypothetical protein PR048_029072 [Dryococelus australis]
MVVGQNLKLPGEWDVRVEERLEKRMAEKQRAENEPRGLYHQLNRLLATMHHYCQKGDLCASSLRPPMNGSTRWLETTILTSPFQGFTIFTSATDHDDMEANAAQPGTTEQELDPPFHRFAANEQCPGVCRCPFEPTTPQGITIEELEVIDIEVGVPDPGPWVEEPRKDTKETSWVEDRKEDTKEITPRTKLGSEHNASLADATFTVGLEELEELLSQRQPRGNACASNAGNWQTTRHKGCCHPSPSLWGRPQMRADSNRSPGLSSRGEEECCTSSPAINPVLTNTQQPPENDISACERASVVRKEQ